MPYTPPAKLSPGISRSESPSLKSSCPGSSQPSPPRQDQQNAPRPTTSRTNSSTSYLHRSRRSPSLTNLADLPTPDPTPESQTFDDRPARTGPSASLRQSPPPLNDLTIPTGAVISPPDSGQNSSDDEDPAKAGRRRQLENLAELQAAISAIEQQREGSPSHVEEERRRARAHLGLAVPGIGADQKQAISSPPLTQEARKISHSRSNTESALGEFTHPMVDSPERSSESDDECDTPRHKPPMLRKKSGELVRPALRPASARRRPSSMPGTPTYSKAVHFDNQLEHVKHFLQVDRPLAVSANTSPVEQYENDNEFPFPQAERWEWEIKLPNFPREGPHRAGMPVRVEHVHLAADKKTLIGVVGVHNLAFHKSVTARFTLDYWKTTSEITAEYNHDIRRRIAGNGGVAPAYDGFDRFHFHLRLEDHVNLENKMLFFCVRYNVNGQEFWDSNDGLNYQVEFAKKSLPARGSSNAARPHTAVPYSISAQAPTTAPGRARPVSMPAFDDFAHGFDTSFSQSTFKLRPKVNREAKAVATGSDRIVPDAPGLRQKAPAQAFGNRYDFSASLSAAIQAAAVTQAPPKAADPKPPDMAKDKPALQSQSYNELIDKYCFFGSKASPATSKPTAAAPCPATAKPAMASAVASADGPSSPPASELSSVSSSERSSPIVTEQPKPAPALKSSRSNARISRSPSPATGSGIGSRTASPVSFGYPYHQPIGQLGGFPEGSMPTAIHG